MWRRSTSGKVSALPRGGAEGRGGVGPGVFEVTGGQGKVAVLGVFLNNAKSHRTKLTAEQLAALAEHGMEWA